MIYLDNHATTACDPRVVEAMLPYWLTAYGNPASPHELGRQAARAMEHSRQQVAGLLGAQAAEIVFTSGATEANNLALLGAARQHERAGGHRRRLVTTAIEHKSVLEPCEWLAAQGWEVVVLPVDAQGTVQWAAAEELITDETLLVSVQAANSEIGTLQDVARLAALAHAHGALLHCDAAQAVGKVVVDVQAWEVDLLSLSAHKLYGPKGVGALYVRGGSQQEPLVPLMRGGSQEFGLRPGTVPVPLVVGLGWAAQLCAEELLTESQRLAGLRDQLEQELLRSLPQVQVNGNTDRRLPHNSSLTFVGVEAEALMANLSELMLSTGAACEAGSPEPSRVLSAIGLSYEDAFCTVRLGLGRFTTEEQVREATESIREAVTLLEALLR
ncbi:cysteine desulfurase family protein [Hymenobacter yonginensis]|uniref:cysteine desulfurase n=1 Tax=Hymenobacter yonginensis TaxID=748197 RepID=A0ABY7PVH7_9BACT|nr:cysteine desulfurase family protein [Hymenobacter yonginensis]WBO86859.1 cysteine desulfurase family protein [Hymenobacter yonginensis]